MIPVIHIGQIEFSTYWLMFGIGTVGMMIYLLTRCRQLSLTVPRSILFTCFLTIVGLSGAKILYILENLQRTLEDGISLSGVSFFGSVFLIPVLMPLIGRLFRLDRGTTMDICGPCVAIMIGCMRFGCFLQGCCGGWEAQLGSVSFIWPTQALESIWDFALLIWLTQKEGDEKYKDKLYPFFMIGYSAARFMLEFLRNTPKDWLYFSHGQWFAVAAVLIGAIWIQNSKKEQ